MSLVSPGVSVTITDESFFIPNGAAGAVPLLFIASADEKTGTDGVSPALGTYEHSRVRTVTSVRQSLDLYGVPNFIDDGAGNQYHGDARNEYGLFALNQFLDIGNRAYVVRANVNLNDNIDDVRALWANKTIDAQTVLENLILQYINDYNRSNRLIVGAMSLLGGQTQASFDGTAPNGSFVGGLGNIATGYQVNDTIQLTNSAVITVTGVDPATGDVIGFSVTTPGVASDGIQLAQLSTSGSGNGFSITPSTNNLAAAKSTVDGAELLSLMKESTQFIFDDVIGSYSFISLADEFFNDLSASPIAIFANGYNSASTGTYPGAEAITTNPAGYPAFGTTATIGEWTPQEGGALMRSLADNFQFTSAFLDGTSLGLNDAARRVSIVTALAAEINSNTDVRSENFDYNLILCPGYPEVVDELAALVTAIQDEALVIADTPCDLTPDGVTNPATGWAASTNKVSSNHVAYYYPWGLASNIDGSNVLISPSGIALRQYAYNDTVSYLWFAPAGIRRGSITGITNVGYVSGTLGTATEFEPIALNQGQRDALYQYAASGMINPIVFFPGRGFVIWGHKTSMNIASAMDRVNVSRLTKYIKRQLRRNTLPFVFEPNDKLTRDNIKTVVDSFLGDLVIKRGLYDFATVCDESNNTPDRIDRNELYVDVAIKPVKAAEFIIIPIRVVSTGADI